MIMLFSKIVINILNNCHYAIDINIVICYNYNYEGDDLYGYHKAEK